MGTGRWLEADYRREEREEVVRRAVGGMVISCVRYWNDIKSYYICRENGKKKKNYGHCSTN